MDMSVVHRLNDRRQRHVRAISRALLQASLTPSNFRCQGVKTVSDIALK